MAVRPDKIRIEIYASTDKVEAADYALRLSDDAVLRLARLIGQQIAREQFERKQVRERKQQRHRPNSNSPS